MTKKNLYLTPQWRIVEYDEKKPFSVLPMTNWSIWRKKPFFDLPMTNCGIWRKKNLFSSLNDKLIDWKNIYCSFFSIHFLQLFYGTHLNYTRTFKIFFLFAFTNHSGFGARKWFPPPQFPNAPWVFLFNPAVHW